MGCSRYLKEQRADVHVTAVEPYLGHKIQGLKSLKEAYVPGIFDKHAVDEKVNVADEDAFSMARAAAKLEGLLVGIAPARRCAARSRSAPVSRPASSSPSCRTRASATSRRTSTRPKRATLRLYDTLARKKTLVRPLTEGQIGIYSCGPTLHDFAHVGLIRRLLAVDVLKRVLLHEGYRVRHIVNLTDVDDKTIAESQRRGVRLEERRGQYAREFFDDVAALRMFPADHYPRATEHVGEDRADGAAVRGRVRLRAAASVYFDIGKLPAYGRLSRVDRSKIKLGATVDLDYYDKADARDFTDAPLGPGRARRRITWKTDWGNVRPGWHIECAAMANRYLGPEFDIHTSGQDLCFPHNENENAICEALFRVPMARHWMHSGMILRGGKKMSRSAGTALTLRDLLARGYTGSQVRYYLLGVHYRRPLDFDILPPRRRREGGFGGPTHSCATCGVRSTRAILTRTSTTPSRPPTGTASRP